MSGAEYFSDQFAINAHMDSKVLVDVEPNTASTEGPSSRTSATVPMM